MATTESYLIPQETPNPVAAGLFEHPIYEHYAEIHKQHLEQNPTSGNIKESLLANLTQDVLKGENKISLRSQSLFIIDGSFLAEFNDIDQILAHQNNHSYTFFHLGDHLSGHPEIVHGGLLATLLDEVTCRLAFQNIKSKKGVTANLNINYYKPCKTGSYVMIKCALVKKSGRKCWVRGEVFHLKLEDSEVDVKKVETTDNLLTSCECLVIEPRVPI